MVMAGETDEGRKSSGTHGARAYRLYDSSLTDKQDKQKTENSKTTTGTVNQNNMRWFDLNILFGY